MSQPSQEQIDQFTGNVKHMVMLQEKLKSIAAQAKDQRSPVKEAFDAVQLQIIDFMKVGNIDVCNYQDEKIELHTVTRYGSLTRKSLKNGLLSYFNGNEDQANPVFDHIINNLGNRELDILKRVKQRKKKKAVPNKRPTPDEQEAAMEDDAPPIDHSSDED